MKIFNSHYSPSIGVLVRTAENTVKEIVIPQGESTVTKAEHEVLMKSESVIGFVKDGYLDFPTCSVLGPLHNQTREERLERERELFNAEEQEPDVSGDLAELTKLVGDQASQLAEAKAENADLAENNKKLQDGMKDLMARMAAMEASAAAAKTAQAPAPAPAPAPAAKAAPAPAAPTSTTPPAPVAPAPAAPVAAPATPATPPPAPAQ